MANYGELIDSNLDLPAMPVYEFFINYFNNPTLSFFKKSDEHIIYGAKVKSQLSKQKRYLFALIKTNPRFARDFPSEIRLRDIQWSCLQIRTLDEDYALPLFTYSVPKINDHAIKLIKKEDSRFTYTCTGFDQISVVLLVTKTQMKPYSDTGTLFLAIETYNCLIYV